MRIKARSREIKPRCGNVFRLENIYEKISKSIDLVMELD
jgi:hypothetical protein